MSSTFTASPGAGRRERKKQQVRESLEGHAFALFGQRGFDAVSIEDITEAADVSRTTFFRYYATKEEVLLTWMRSLGDEAAEVLIARPSDESPLVALRAALLVLSETYGQDRDRALVVERLRRDSPTVGRAYRDKIAYWEDVLAAALARRSGHDLDRDLYPRLVARMAMAAVTTAGDVWAARGNAGRVQDLLDRALSTIDDRPVR